MTEPTTPESEAKPRATEKAAAVYHKAMHRLGGLLHRFGGHLQRKHGPEDVTD